MKALIMALFVSGLFAANLDISDSIAPSQDNANPSANPPANQANPANQPQNNANPPMNQSANPNTANQAKPNNANQANQVANPSANQPTQSAQATQPKAQTPAPKAQKEQKPRPSDPDERLKEDIVNFEREKHIQDSASVDDPFIYVYQQTEDEVARRAQLEQAVLTLKSIIIAPDSNNNRIKRYKAHINNQWVEECRVVGKSRQCDSIEGWEVASITEDSVKLRVTRYNMKRDLQLMNKRVTIKKEVNYK